MDNMHYKMYVQVHKIQKDDIMIRDREFYTVVHISLLYFAGSKGLYDFTLEDFYGNIITAHIEDVSYIWKVDCEISVCEINQYDNDKSELCVSDIYNDRKDHNIKITKISQQKDLREIFDRNAQNKHLARVAYIPCDTKIYEKYPKIVLKKIVKLTGHIMKNIKTLHNEHFEILSDELCISI